MQRKECSRHPSHQGHRDALAWYLNREFGPLPDPDEVGSPDFPVKFVILTEDLIDQKAWVHSTTWRETYENMLPRPLVQLVSPDFAKNVTLRHGADGFAHTVLVLAGRRVIGFAEWLDAPRPPFVDPENSACSSNETLGTCEKGQENALLPGKPAVGPPVELGAIYLLACYRHRGLGSRLFEETMKAAGNPRRVMLWVLQSNDSAKRFYRHLGFQMTGQIQEEDHGQIVEEALLLDRDH